MKITYRNIDDLSPYERNAKLHPDSQVARIARSIQEFGFRNPVLVDGQGEIVAGHGRVLAAKKAGLTEVPTLDASDMTPEQVKAYRMVDNKLAESDWDWDLAKLEIGELQEAGFDVELLGFDEGEIREILSDNQNISVEEDNSEEKGFIELNECPKCGYKWRSLK